MLFADVYVDLSVSRVDQSYQYIIPDELLDQVKPGTGVFVPFGKRKISGYVTGTGTEAKVDPDKLKPILAVDPAATVISEDLMKLAVWMRANYGSTMNQALRCVLLVAKKEPPKLRKIIHLAVSREVIFDELAVCKKRAKHSLGRERMLEALLENSDIPREELTERLSVSSPVIRDLEKKGLITIEEIRSYRDPLGKLRVSDAWDIPKLNDTQRAIADEIISKYDMGLGGVNLIRGVTGSGKTEVYMEIMDHVIKSGRSVIFLIPEISLTYQTVMRLYKRFGAQVSILHSRMSPGERFDQFERAKSGDIRIMVGPRSALFTPFSDVGLIIIDEEHDGSYKSETIPKYHARETAIERAGLLGATVVLGSATPSVESSYNANCGKYRLFVMEERAGDAILPQVEITDMRKELEEGNRSILSRRLRQLMEERLDRGEQTMLFINRRGLAGFVSCRACGKVIKCPHCDVSLTHHRGDRLICHYCGFTTSMVKSCPDCGSPFIGTMKLGTEKVEAIVTETFPHAGVLRMDADTTRGKEGHSKILETFADHGADILIGTQMIVKGHDFADVTLMGILAADLSLNESDYRSAERTFQLLTQACGRPGRRDREGIAVIQTYRPEHFSIAAAAAGDYEAFYKQEIAYRKLLSYPPLGHILMIEITSQAEGAAFKMGKYIEALTGSAEDCFAMPLTDAGISKIRDVYRKQIMVRSGRYESLVAIKDIVDRAVRDEGAPRGADVWFDFDPMNRF